MQDLKSHDGDRVIDWGKSSADYAAYRAGPPPSFFTRLAAFGIGLEGQSILDLGTGTGVLARRFARQGAVACGIDVSSEQIEAANRLSHDENLAVQFSVHPAESLP